MVDGMETELYAPRNATLNNLALRLANPEDTLDGIDVDEIVTTIRQEEDRIPSETDVYKLGNVTKTRKDLSEQGVHFVNVIGDCEKPILNMKIDGVDYGKKPFLTKEEIEVFRTLDEAELKPFSNAGTTVDVITHDMTKFLYTFLVKEIRRHRLTDKLYRDCFFPPYQGIIKAITKRPINRKEYEKRLTETLEREELSNYRGFETFARFPGRNLFALHKLNNTPCPFTDCGYTFSVNPDFVLYELRNEKKMGYMPRINEVSRHLATHGISERGGSVNGSWDQTYMTIAEYASNVLPRI